MSIFTNCSKPIIEMQNADFELNRLRREKTEKESICAASGTEKCETATIDNKIEQLETTKKNMKSDVMKCTIGNLLK